MTIVHLISKRQCQTKEEVENRLSKTGARFGKNLTAMYSINNFSSGGLDVQTPEFQVTLTSVMSALPA